MLMIDPFMLRLLIVFFVMFVASVWLIFGWREMLAGVAFMALLSVILYGLPLTFG